MRYLVNIQEVEAKEILDKTFLNANETLASDIIIDASHNLAFCEVPFISIDLNHTEVKLLQSKGYTITPDEIEVARFNLLGSYYYRTQLESRKFDLKGIIGRNVKIGCLDTGCNDVLGLTIDHGVNYADGNPGYADNLNHGTIGASIIKSNVGNANGVELHVIKVVNDSGNITSGAFTAGINYAIAQGLDAVYMPFELYFDGIYTLIDSLVAANCIPFCSAGNSISLSNVVEPANYNKCVAVGAIKEDETAGYLSLLNPNIAGQHGVDFLCGGYGAAAISSAGSNINCYGTSFSAPLAAAVFARYKEMTSLPNKEVLQVMKNNCQKADPNFGLGILKC